MTLILGPPSQRIGNLERADSVIGQQRAKAAYIYRAVEPRVLLPCEAKPKRTLVRTKQPTRLQNRPLRLYYSTDLGKPCKVLLNVRVGDYCMVPLF